VAGERLKDDLAAAHDERVSPELHPGEGLPDDVPELTDELLSVHLERLQKASREGPDELGEEAADGSGAAERPALDEEHRVGRVIPDDAVDAQPEEGLEVIGDDGFGLICKSLHGSRSMLGRRDRKQFYVRSDCRYEIRSSYEFRSGIASPLGKTRMKYGQFCPVARASEILGERWTLLVLRELVAGSTRYTELQRGLGRISPSVLSARLRTLTEQGILERHDAGARQGVEYRLTPAGAELAAVIESIGVWGQRWVRSRMTRDELDVELLMLHVQRHFDAAAFPEDHGVVAFVFTDLQGTERRWWLLVDDERTELCADSPGRKVDVTFTCRLRTLAEVFVGDTTLDAARGNGRLEVGGAPKLVRGVHRWLRIPALAAVPRATTG
jgi:DNA-binding HxlR family transcriptional regulator